MSNRVISIIILAVMLITVSCISAAADVRPTVTVGAADAKSGETVDIPVTFSDCAGFASLGIEIGYDSEKFTLEEVTPTLTGYNYTTAQTLEVNPYILKWVNRENVVYSGKLVTLTFRVKSDVPAGSYPVTVEYYKGRNNDWQDGVDVNFDENYNTLNLKYTDGAINVLGSNTVTVTAGGKSAVFESNQALTGVIIIRQYDDVNRLVDVRMFPVATTPADGFTVEKTGTTVEAMWWYDTDSSMQPVCKKKLLE